MNAESWWTERQSGSQVSCLFILFRQIIPTVIILLSKEKNGLTWTIFYGFLFPSTKGQKTILLEPDPVFQLNCVWLLERDDGDRGGGGEGGENTGDWPRVCSRNRPPAQQAKIKERPLGLCCECNIVITQEIEKIEKNQRVKWMERAKANSFHRKFLPVILEDILVFGGDDSFCTRILGKAALFLANSYLTHLPLVNKG